MTKPIQVPTKQRLQPTRRPLKSRRTTWAIATANWLASSGVTPNQISCASIVFALLAGLGSVLTIYGQTSSWRVTLMIAIAVCIQLRLACNLMDGMVAIEGGFKTRAGEIYNDLPDRLSDALILIPAGYAIAWTSWGSTLGWAAALLAMLVAYVRVLGGAVGLPQDFCGPMAKQHRMAVMTAAWLGSIIELFQGWSGWILTLALGVIIVGSAATAARRTQRIVRTLEQRA